MLQAEVDRVGGEAVWVTEERITELAEELQCERGRVAAYYRRKGGRNGREPSLRFRE